MRLAALTLISLLVAACSITSGTEVLPGHENKVQGVRYYLPKPILIVQNNTARVEFIPNTDRVFALHFGAFLAKNNSEVTINTNGTLGVLKANLDSTDALASIEALLERTLGASNLSEGGVSDRESGISVAVYEFVFDGAGNLTDLRKLL